VSEKEGKNRMTENEEMDSQPEVQTMMIDTTDKGKNFLK